MFAFAKSNGDYGEEAQQHVQKTGGYLGINKAQFDIRNEVAQKTNAATLNLKKNITLLSGLSSDAKKLQASGINGSGLLKGLSALQRQGLFLTY